MNTQHNLGPTAKNSGQRVDLAWPKEVTYHWVSWLICSFACASLLLSSVITAHKRRFWNDEILSIVLLSDTSFTHMLSAWSDTFNQAPPLYFMIGWFWDKVFGGSEISLRLFGSLCLCTGLIFTWRGLARAWNELPAAIGTVSVYCLSNLILYHNAEARMYGLFVAFTGVTFYLFQRISSSEKNTNFLYVLNVLANSALVLTHLYGILYSAALCGSLVLSDLLVRRRLWRPGVYASFVLAWASIIPFIPGLINQSHNHARWLQAVSLHTLKEYYGIGNGLSSYLILLLLLGPVVCGIGLVFRARHSENEQAPSDQAKISSAIAYGAFMAIPTFAWIFSATVKPMLLERYIIPTIAIAWPTFASFAVNRLFFFEAREDDGSLKARGAGGSPTAPHSAEKARRLGTNVLTTAGGVITAGALTAAAIANPLWTAVSYSDEGLPGQSDRAYGYANLPIAVEAGHDYLPRMYYSNDSRLYFHIRDWKTATRNTESLFATGDYTHLSALNRQYPYVQSIESAEFLTRFNRFLVLNEESQKWLEWRIMMDPAYKVTRLGPVPGSNGLLTQFLVEKR